MVLLIVLLLLVYAAYALLEDKNIYANAQSDNLEQYKPVTENSPSFKELQEINSEVKAWVQVYGTKIDYPVAHSSDGRKYLSTAIDGSYSIAGSIYLDPMNKSDFSDFNTFIYGHHMEESAMFGDLDKFMEEDFFKSRQYGNLYYNGQDYGIEFFAYIVADAYDWTLYNPAIKGNADDKKAYISYLEKTALYKRDIEVSENDRIILLSTCAAEPTNGRHILAGRITENTYDDSFAISQKSNKGFSVDLQRMLKSITEMSFVKIMIVLFICILAVIVLIVLESRFIRKRRYGVESKVEEQEKHKSN